MDLEQQIFLPADKPRPGWKLLTFTIVLVLINVVLGFRNSRLSTGDFSAACGGAGAPCLWAALMALLFSISPRFRSDRSKTKVAIWTLIAFMFGGLGNMTDSANRALVREVNAVCPKMIDAETRMDGATVGPGKSITFRETTVGVDGANIDRVKWQKVIAPRIRSSAVTTPFVRRILSSGVTVYCHYTGRDGVFIGEIQITPRDLQGN